MSIRNVHHRHREFTVSMAFPNDMHMIARIQSIIIDTTLDTIARIQSIMHMRISFGNQTNCVRDSRRGPRSCHEYPSSGSTVRGLVSSSFSNKCPRAAQTVPFANASPLLH
jgi:hypothetical protein